MIDQNWVKRKVASRKILEDLVSKTCKFAARHLASLGASCKPNRHDAGRRQKTPTSRVQQQLLSSGHDSYQNACFTVFQWGLAFCCLQLEPFLLTVELFTYSLLRCLFV